MALTVKIGLMDLWAIYKLALETAQTTDNQAARKQFNMVTKRLPPDAKAFIAAMHEKEKTIDV
jgi:hypothetical protein